MNILAAPLIFVVVSLMPTGFETLRIGMTEEEFRNQRPDAVTFPEPEGGKEETPDEARQFLERLDGDIRFSFASYSFLHGELCGAVWTGAPSDGGQEAGRRKRLAAALKHWGDGYERVISHVPTTFDLENPSLTKYEGPFPALRWSREDEEIVLNLELVDQPADAPSWKRRRSSVGVSGKTCIPSQYKELLPGSKPQPADPNEHSKLFEDLDAVLNAPQGVLFPMGLPDVRFGMTEADLAEARPNAQKFVIFDDPEPPDEHETEIYYEQMPSNGSLRILQFMFFHDRLCVVGLHYEHWTGGLGEKGADPIFAWMQFYGPKYDRAVLRPHESPNKSQPQIVWSREGKEIILALPPPDEHDGTTESKNERSLFIKDMSCIPESFRKRWKAERTKYDFEQHRDLFREFDKLEETQKSKEGTE